MKQRDFVMGAQLFWKGAPYVVDLEFSVRSNNDPTYNVYLKYQRRDTDNPSCVCLGLLASRPDAVVPDCILRPTLKEGLLNE